MPDFANVFQLANRPTVGLESYSDHLAKAQQLRDLGQQSQVRGMQLQQLGQTQADDQAVRSAFQNGVNPDGSVNQQKVLGDLAKTNPMAAQKLHQQWQGEGLAAQKGNDQAKEAEIKTAIAKLDHGARVMGGVRDQLSYEAAIQEAGKLGADVSHFPPAYDPAFVQGVVAKGLSAKEQMEARLKASPTGWHEGMAADGKTPTVYQVDPTTGKPVDTGIKPIPKKEPGAGGTGMGTVPGASQDYAKRLVQGLEPWPSSLSIRTDPTIREGIQMARTMDPGFNASTHGQREKTSKAFTTGAESQTLNKIGTALSHLSEYSDALEKVPDTGMGPLNSVMNKARGAMGNVDIARANTIQTTLANELEGAYRSGGGTEAGIAHMRELLDPNLPKEARRANLATVTSLLQGKQDAMLQQYNRGMGKFGQPLDVISPEGKAAQDKVLSRAGMAGKSEGPVSTSSKWAPISASGSPDMATIGKNPRFKDAVWVGQGAPSGGGWYHKNEDGTVTRVE